MMADIVSKVEKLLQRELSQEEKERFTRVKDILGISDDDAIWDLLVAMEYQRTYYETLPEKIRDTVSQVIAEIRENVNGTEHKEATQKDTIQDIKTAKQVFQQWLVMGAPLLALLILYGSLTMWAGYCIGAGSYHSPLLMLKMPVGVLAGIIAILAGAYMAIMAAKTYANSDTRWRKLTVPIMLCLIFGSALCSISFSL